MNTSPMSQNYARLIISVGLVSAGVATLYSLAGDYTMSLYICGAGLVISLVILLIGAFMVGATKKLDE